MALKDCTFFVDVNGKQVEMDYDQFRSYLLDGTNLSALAPTLAQKKGAKAGFETAKAAPVEKKPAAKPAPAKPVAGQVETVTAEPSEAERIADSVGKQKMDAQGFTSPQREFLVEKTREVYEDIQNPSTPSKYVIKVPGDGQFTITSPTDANGLHRRLTGQNVPGAISKHNPVNAPPISKAENLGARGDAYSNLFNPIRTAFSGLAAGLFTKDVTKKSKSAPATPAGLEAAPESGLYPLAQHRAEAGVKNVSTDKDFITDGSILVLTSAMSSGKAEKVKAASEEVRRPDASKVRQVWTDAVNNATVPAEIAGVWQSSTAEGLALIDTPNGLITLSPERLNAAVKMTNADGIMIASNATAASPVILTRNGQPVGMVAPFVYKTQEATEKAVAGAREAINEMKAEGKSPTSLSANLGKPAAAKPVETPVKTQAAPAAPEPNAPQPITVQSLQDVMGINKSMAEAVMAVYKALGIPLPKIRLAKGVETGGKEQAEGAIVRGSIYFNSKAEQEQMDGVLAVIRGFSAANVTTPIHEAAHFYRRFMLNVENGFTPEEIKAAEDWAGARNGKWSVKAEEKWARGFERYLRSGESPLPSLTKLFEKMAKWFQGIYKVVAGSPIDVEITPEVKRVFDRMFELQAKGQKKTTGSRGAESSLKQQESVLERDKEYLAALNAGDTAKAQEMAIETAKQVVTALPRSRNTSLVPNTSSISSTLTEYLNMGVREVPMSWFGIKGREYFYSPSDRQRVDKIAKSIQEQGVLSPLIVVVDGHPNGLAYVLEGSHRIAAIAEVGLQNFPALVIIDEDLDPSVQDEHGTIINLSRRFSPKAVTKVEQGLNDKGPQTLKQEVEQTSQVTPVKTASDLDKAALKWAGVSEMTPAHSPKANELMREYTSLMDTVRGKIIDASPEALRRLPDYPRSTRYTKPDASDTPQERMIRQMFAADSYAIKLQSEYTYTALDGIARILGVPAADLKRLKDLYSVLKPNADLESHAAVKLGVKPVSFSRLTREQHEQRQRDIRFEISILERNIAEYTNDIFEMELGTDDPEGLTELEFLLEEAELELAALREKLKAPAELVPVAGTRSNILTDPEQFKTGQPALVTAYHGTDEEGIKGSAFAPSFGGALTNALSAQRGYFFAGSPITPWRYARTHMINANLSKKGKVFKFFVKFQNPLVYDMNGSTYREQSYADLMGQAKRAGHDGVIILNTFDGATLDTIFTVLHGYENQIKSAEPKVYTEDKQEVPLSERFSESTNILYQEEGPSEKKEGINYAEIGRKIAERRAEAAKKAKEGQAAAPPEPSARQQARPTSAARRPLKVKPPQSLEEMLSDVEKDIQAKAGKASRTSQEEANYRADREVRSLLREYALKAFQGRFGDELELPDGTKVSRRAELLSAIAELQAILKDPALRQNQRLIDRAKVYRRIDYALLAPPKASKKINPSLRNKLTGHAWGEWSPRSPLSYAQYIGSYERLAGATGRDVSDTFNTVRTMFARGQYRNFAGAMSDLRLRLRPLKDQLREQGYHGLPALIDAHVERLEDATRNIGELTWANVKKAWDENPVNLVSTLAKAFIFNAKLRFSIKSIGLNFIQPLSTLYPYFTASELADLYKRSLTKSEIERVRAIAIAESGGRFTQEMREGVKSRLPNPFQRSSEQVRIMGHLAGEMLADRDKMPPGIERDMFIRSWAEKAEFDNSPWNIGPLFSGPIASVLLQFKPFMFKNLERFATDIRPQKTDRSWITARQAKVILTQLGIGGMSSLMTLVPVVGTALIGPGMLALLAKSLGAMADDDEFGEQLAEAFYYGAPSLFGVDLSSSVEFISEPMGKTAAEQVLNVIGGPLVATSVSAYTQGKDMVSLAMRPKKVGEKEEVDKKLREKALRLSKAITPLAGMAEAAAGLATGDRPTMFLNEKEPYTTGETARKMFGFTPLRQTIYYDRKESPAFIQKFAGRQPDVPGITRERGETDATYRVRVQRVEEYRQKYGNQLLSHPRYKTLDEETKQKALEIINGNISTESAKKRPDVRNLNPLYVMRRAKESIRQAPRREKKQLYVPPDED